MPRTRYRQVPCWREGTNGPLRSRFAALRIRRARREEEHIEFEPEQWLLIEWLKGASEPEKYFLRTLPTATPVRELERLAKLRWHIERDYEELKQELGLGQDELKYSSWAGREYD